MDEPTDVAPALPPLPIARNARAGGRLAVLMVAALMMGLLGLVAVAVAGRVVHASPWWLTVAVVLLPYSWVALMSLGFTSWCVWPDRGALAGLTALGTCGLFAMYGPSWAARPEPAEGEPLRVMSWNVRRLWGWGEVGPDAGACVVAAVEAADPDVLTLLEVSADDIAWLSQQVGLTCVHATYHAGGGPTRGGLATCVRGGRATLRGGGGQRFVDDEDWSYVFTEIGVGERVFNLLAVHLVPYAFRTRAIGRTGVAGLASHGDHTVRAQADQTRALLDRVARFRDPTILAGDFNSTRDMALHASLRRHLTDAWERGGLGFGATVTALSYLPVRVDYVYVTPSFAVQSATVGTAGCSDHQPVIAEVVLRAP